MVVDDFTVAAPAQLNGLLCMDAPSSHVAAGAEPVLLRRGSCPGHQSSVCRARDGVGEHFIDELDITRHNARRQVVLHCVQSFEDERELAVCPAHENLERSEQPVVAVAKSSGLALGPTSDSIGTLQRWLDCPIAFRDAVPCVRLAAKSKLRSWNFEASVNVGKKPLVVPSQNWAASEILKRAL